MRRGSWAVATLVLVAGAVGLSRELWWAEGTARPNIVVLLWDTTRADRLSAFGYPRRTTPWLKSLAARGVRFEQCRTPAPWTLPSHASLFTGLLPRHHGASHIESPLAPAHRTLAERLDDAGYDTVLVYENINLAPASGLAQGFDRVLDVLNERGSGAGPSFEVLAQELAERRQDPARSARPLFLFVNLMEPHLSYDPPPALAQPWLPEQATKEAVVLARNLGIRKLDVSTFDILGALYDAEVADLDAHCARVEDLLEREGILGEGVDTLFVVTADHGENLGEHGLIDHKLSVADPLLHVPLVMHWPGHLEGGRSVAEQVRLQDLFPTLLEAAGLDWDPTATPFATSLLETPLSARPQVYPLQILIASLAGWMRWVGHCPTSRPAP